MGRTVGRFICLVVLLLMILVGGGFALHQARYHLFPCAVYSRIDMLHQGTPLGKRIAYVVADRTLFLDSDGLRIAADIFEPPPGGPAAPGVLMLHGSSRWGRQIAITRLLSRKLSERGYLVVSIDFRGFGDSDVPAPIDSPQAWLVENDIRTGIDFLASHEGVDPGRIAIVGHSMGGAYGIYGGIEDERVGKIVALGPTRRYQERFPAEKEEFVARFARDRRLAQKISVDLFAASHEPYILENTFNFFTTAGHKPLLLIDGALESEEDRKFLQAYSERMAEPKRYVTLDGTCHYLGVVGFEVFERVPFLRHAMVYDEGIVEHAVEVIESFLVEEAIGPPI
jgi:pimeloyl-ACP methyl ester carboxylesterase